MCVEGVVVQFADGGGGGEWTVAELHAVLLLEEGEFGEFDGVLLIVGVGVS